MTLKEAIQEAHGNDKCVIVVYGSPSTFKISEDHLVYSDWPSRVAVLTVPEMISDGWYVVELIEEVEPWKD